MKNKNICNSGSNCAIYGMGVIGALFYFIPLVSGFWPVVLAILKSLAWPAILVINLFKFLAI